jgi:2-polyprenyl-3-methyl-5-hydroxy-6-metoxy-1,4-benzoquinol methylase
LTTPENVSCNLCRTDQARLFLATPVDTLVQCRHCRLIYVNPRPMSKDTDYEEAFFLQEYKDVYGVDYIEDRANITRLARARLEVIERHKQGGKLLDVGCAAGFLLDEARQRGWETRGVEISQFASQYARQELKLDVFTGTLEGAKFPAAEFDVVVLYFVLEHLRDPLALLQEISRILKPGGLLSLAVPNIAGLYFRLKRKEWIAERTRHQSHFYEFSPSTLRRMLARAGLHTVALTSEGRYTRGHVLAGWVKRLRLGNVLLAYAVKTP